MKIGFKSPKEVLRKIFLLIANLPMPGSWRWRIIKLSGVKFNLPTDKNKRFSFIGENVVFDSLSPQNIHIGNNVVITTGCIILTHKLDLSKGITLRWDNWIKANTIIEDNVYIGANSIITRPVTIGEGSIIGAGSVITKDIPPRQMWAGCPARYIRDVYTES